MAMLRQSLLACGYIFFIIPNLKSGADVLKQNIMAQDKESIKIQGEIEDLKEKRNEIEQKEYPNVAFEDQNYMEKKKA